MNVTQDQHSPVHTASASAKSALAADRLSPAPAGTVQIQGWLGERMDACIEHRVMAQSLDAILTPFRERKEHDGSGWRCEYWGKWMTSAVLATRYQPSESHRAVIDNAVASLRETQSDDGYIGTYTDDTHLGIWDVWGRKYVLLGLLAHHAATGDPDSLATARAVADHLIAEAPPETTRLSDLGIDVLTGLAPSSILEPMVLLHRATGEQRYLDFAWSIVDGWSVPGRFLETGLRLVEGALQGVAPRQLGGSPKSYEMMSCFEGLIELFRETGEARLRDAALAFAGSIVERERTIVGSASNQELWCDGASTQTELWEQPQETCVTVTWMKLCHQLLRLTGDPRWADELERSLWNALPAAMMPDARWWAYWCPLHGERIASLAQHSDVGLSCCVANGPRGLLLTADWAVMENADGPVVNLLAPLQATVRFAGDRPARLEVRTDYPLGGDISIHVALDRPADGTIAVRIPAWSTCTVVDVNGEPVDALPGEYVRIVRTWNDNDSIRIRLDMRGRCVPAPSGAPQVAVERGPLVLALDSRFAPFDNPENTDKAAWVVGNADGTIDLEPIAAPEGVHAAFRTHFTVRPTHFFQHHAIEATLVDFASAGNQWTEENRFRTWLPQPLHLRHAFPADTWRLMSPRSETRPEPPADTQSPCSPISFS